MDSDSSGTIVRSRVRNFDVNKAKIQNLADSIRSHLNILDYELSVELVSSRHIKKLNHEFRGIAKATDVLSFPQKQWSPPILISRNPSKAKKTFETATSREFPELLGDVVISPEVAMKNAESIGQNLDREISFLLVHGILHLCGHDHEKTAEERVMLRQQRRLMELISSDKPPIWADCVRIKTNG